MREIRSEMIKFPYVAGPKMPVVQAFSYMKECDIRHLPVMDESELVGVVSERDLMPFIDRDEETEVVVGDIMSRSPFFVDETSDLAETVSIMANKKYGSALIVNDQGHLVGIFTTTDALNLLCRLLTEEPELQMETDYSKRYALKDIANWA